ncbi:MAG: NUDIX hydrolase [Deltaproteobacteria bacterium]|nr:NUDIX hydrolase [Deltaproteobacteria bacterium]
MVRPFERSGERILLETPIFRLREEESRHPDTGHQGRYYVLENPDWVNIVALTPERDLVLVRQWRHGTRRIETEIPAGMLEPGEDPLQAAARELEEETGYTAERWTLLGSARPNAAYQSNTCYTALAEGCRQTHATRFDPGEDLEVELVSLERLRGLVRDGTLANGMMLVGIFWWLERTGAVGWPGG